jgi:hypothetical protein
MCKNYTLKCFKTDPKEFSLLFAEFLKKWDLTLLTKKNYLQMFLSVPLEAETVKVLLNIYEQ